MRQKTAYLNLRINPAVKEALLEAADKEHRSITNFLEILIQDHCMKASIKVRDTSARSSPLTGKRGTQERDV